MQIQDKALYNLLRLNWLKDPTLDVLPWQVEDYRALGTVELFKRLQALGIVMDPDRFVAGGEHVGTPEELVEVLWTKDDIPGRDQAYLLLFELWRRLLPEKQTLSLFCDELDHQIFLYDEKQEIEGLDLIISHLEDLLDSYVDEGEDPQEMFQMVSQGCAYDLERFLYEYSLDLIDAEEETMASEIIDAFFDYVVDKKKFEFLRICLFARVDPHETAILFKRFFDALKEKPNLELALEMAHFLITFGQDPLFKEIILQALKWVKTEDEFQQVLLLLEEYFRCLDQEEKEKVITGMLQKRASLSPQTLQVIQTCLSSGSPLV